MNECTIDKAHLSAYVDGELTADDRRAVERHLEACEACRRDLATLRAVRGRFEADACPSVAHDEWEEIWSGVEPDLPAGRSRRWSRSMAAFVRRRPLLAAAAAVLLLVGAGLLGWSLRPPQPVSENGLPMASDGEVRVESFAYDSEDYTLIMMAPGEQGLVMWLKPTDDQ